MVRLPRFINISTFRSFSFFSFGAACVHVTTVSASYYKEVLRQLMKDHVSRPELIRALEFNNTIILD